MTEKVLVTGGNGFLALHIIKGLLQQGFDVRTTLRTLSKKEEVLAALQQNHVPNLDHLSFAAADLTTDNNWDEAMHGITYVLSVASPVFVNGEKTTAQLEQTATDGTLRIIKAAERAHVKRVVMTGNFGAVGFSNKDPQHITTEQDWTNPNEVGLSPYEKSKLIAEQAAWHYLKSSSSQLEFTVINPGAMLGPGLDQHVSGSFGIIKGLIDGSTKMIPNIQMNVVDVRDVATMHILAMTNSNVAGQRFLAVDDQAISMPAIAELIRQQRPHLAAQIPTTVLPGWLIKFASLFNQQAKEGRLFLEINHNVSNQLAKDILGWQPLHQLPDTILSAVDMLAEN